ncbi:hypothetical protein F4859DRAFT_497231 [Xylaria cf. heliscus]|nr:hypothetical protein F4859DRAFT_497231 [Xylaria cf. heliscus]
MVALTTLFTHSSWCSNRFVVFVDDHAPGTSIIPPSSGWIDPSFTKCIPTQYTTAYPTFSPGVCPAHMIILDIEVKVHNSKEVYTAACCQSGFSPMSVDSGYLCTSIITSPMAFLLDPNITTADIYTTLPPELRIEHDQVTVQWEPTGLALFPIVVSSQYARLMGITAPPSTDNVATETIGVLSSCAGTPKLTAAPMTPIIWPTPLPKPIITIPTSQLSTPSSHSHVKSMNNSALQGLGGSAFSMFLLIGMIITLMA